MVKIVEMDNTLSKQAYKLIFRVFPHDSILGVPLFFFWLYKKRGNAVIKKIWKLLGFANFRQLWVAI